jgi:hypothetical protein
LSCFFVAIAVDPACELPLGRGRRRGKRGKIIVQSNNDLKKKRKKKKKKSEMTFLRLAGQ